jgi:hypothetical protein
MRAVFKEIIDGDVEAIRQRLEGKPAEAMALAAKTPKRYAGQSTLQVAYQHGRFEIAALLLQAGADPNFIEHSEREPWAMPVLHHAIMAAVQRSRWLAPTWREEDPWRLRSTVERADGAFAALEHLLDSGADVGVTDSYGNTSLARATLDARQILPSYHHNDPDWVYPKPLNPELVDDLRRIFDTLVSHGADLEHVDPRSGNKTLADFYGPEPVTQFLRA